MIYVVARAGTRHGHQDTRLSKYFKDNASPLRDGKVEEMEQEQFLELGRWM